MTNDNAQTGAVEFLVSARIDRLGRQIRRQLVRLRRQKIELQVRRSQPARNPKLDAFLGDLFRLRQQLDSRICRIEATRNLDSAVERALERTLDIRGDILEMVDLLYWFGAHSPADTGADRRVEYAMG
jgi:hypothetical protein